MNRYHLLKKRIILSCLIGMLFLLNPANASPGYEWSDDFFPNGVGGSIGSSGYLTALTMGHDGLVYAAGRFQAVGRSAANNIAKLDPSTQKWNSLGTGLDGYVVTLITGVDGSIYAGQYIPSGRSGTSNLAKWDPITQTWSTPVAGLDGEIKALTTDADGLIYVGGDFTTADGITASNIAVWDPIDQSLSALGTGVDGSVNALNIVADGSLYAGGDFTTAGGSSISYIAKWDPIEQTWSALGAGVDDVVYALTTGEDGSLYAGGDFDTDGEAYLGGIAKWDPVAQTWSALGVGSSGRVYTLTKGIDGSIYAGGSGSFVEGESHIDTDGNYVGGQSYIEHVAKWNPITQEWGKLGSGVNDTVRAIFSGTDGSLYAGGYFDMAGGSAALRFAKWDQTSQMWSAQPSQGSGVENAVRALIRGSDGTVYAGGSFSTAGGSAASRIAKLDPTTQTWSGLAGGLDFGSVHTLTVGTDGIIYAGGSFQGVVRTPSNPNYVSVRNIAKWDPATQAWSSLGGGPNNYVHALTTGLDGTIYAGGFFSKVNGVAINHITKWDPATQAWSALGSGLNGSVRALATGGDGSIYAAGQFTMADGSAARNIARWDPTTQTWSALGAGLDGYVFALTETDGVIYAGGYFNTAGESEAAGIAKWDTTTQTWSALATGLTDQAGFERNIRTLTTGSDGAVYAGGVFSVVGGVDAKNIARWDPIAETWSALDAGVNAIVLALAAGADESIYAGGHFTTAGDNVSSRFARWSIADSNIAPTITSPTSASVAENQTAAIDVQASDDNDSEASGLSFSKTGGADQDLFDLDSTTGVLAFSSAPDFELPEDAGADNVYEVKVTVTDSGGLTDMQNIVITVANELDGIYTELSAIQGGSGYVEINGTQSEDHMVITGTGPGSLEITDGANDGAPVGMYSGVTSLLVKGLNDANHVEMISVDIPNGLNYIGGNGADVLEITESLKVGGFMNIDLASGDNTIATTTNTTLIEVMFNASIETRTGDDKVEIANITTGNHLTIDVASGDDEVLLGVAGGTFVIGNRLTINAGSGNNTVRLLNGEYVNAVQAYSGSGMDEYEIRDSIGKYGDILSGGGIDIITSDSNTFSKRYRIDCGPAVDVYGSSNDQGSPFIESRCE